MKEQEKEKPSMSLSDWRMDRWTTNFPISRGASRSLEHQHYFNDWWGCVKLDGFWCCCKCLKVAPKPIQYIATLSFCNPHVTLLSLMSPLEIQQIKENIKEYEAEERRRISRD